METTIERFLDVMRQEKEIYDELSALADQKQPAIQAKNTADLDKIVRKEQGAVLRLGQLEEQRTACVEAFAARHKTRPESLSMLQIAALAPAPYGEELRKLHDGLFALVQKLSAQNKAHRSLLEGKLAFVRFASDYMSAEQGAGGYNASGFDKTGDGKPKLSLIDRKI